MPPRYRKTNDSIATWTIADMGNFYADHRSELRSRAYRILKDHSRAEEIVQDSIVKVLLAAPELTSREHALAYLHRVVRNTCIDHLRAEGRQPHLVLLDDKSVAFEDVSTTEATPEELLISADDAAIVRGALSLLSAAERAALVMWEVEGRSSIDIAKELGITESSVRHTVSRARSSLRRILSELVLDEEKGLTGLDLLSKTYRKTSTFVKKSSRLALSFLLIFSAVLGFDSLYRSTSPIVSTPNANEVVPTTDTDFDSTGMQDFETFIGGDARKNAGATLLPLQSFKNTKREELSFPGLDESGLPEGYSVSDSSGSLGDAYFNERTTVASESEFAAGQLIKTKTGAANILLLQNIKVDSTGLFYAPTLSFGQAGMWVPLEASTKSTEIRRNPDGNYLFTAFIKVESPIETPIKITSSANGRDLLEAPDHVITRILLDPSKTQVLGQAVYVVERGA